MSINTKSYPQPVLGNEDDLGGFFKVEFRYELAKDEVTLSPIFSIKNPSIENLIKNGAASFVAEVECRSTFYRKSFSTRNESARFSIPSRMVRERVIVGFYICADKDIGEYTPSDPHPDYAGSSFEIEKGDVLAIGGFCAFIAEKSFDPLRPPVSSFMSIREGAHHEGIAEIDYDSDKITIILSKAEWRNYLGVRGDKIAEGILHGSIVLPVLVDAIYHLQSASNEYENMNWFGRLEAILDAKGLRGKDPFEAAQKILDNPAKRSLEGLMSLLEVTDGQE